MTYPVRSLRVGPTDVALEHRADGALLLRSPHPLAAHPAKITAQLGHWARAAPGRVLFAQRQDGGEWKSVTYRDARRRARAIATALLARKLSVERPLAVLSGNDLEHALLQLAALYIGVPYAPVSPAYSLLSADYAQLRHVVALVAPAQVYAADEKRFGAALAAALPRA